jgi:hypothetical protein
MTTVLTATKATSTGQPRTTRSALRPHTSHQPTKAPPTPVGRRTHAANPATIAVRGPRGADFATVGHHSLPAPPPFSTGCAVDSPAEAQRFGVRRRQHRRVIPFLTGAVATSRRSAAATSGAPTRPGARPGPPPRRLDCLKVLSRSCSALLPVAGRFRSCRSPARSRARLDRSRWRVLSADNNGGQPERSHEATQR